MSSGSLISRLIFLIISRRDEVRDDVAQQLISASMAMWSFDLAKDRYDISRNICFGEEALRIS